MKLAVLSLLAGSAAAFAPASSSKASTALNSESPFLSGALPAVPLAEPAPTVDATAEPGVCSPLNVYDPLGNLGPDPTKADAAKFNMLRYYELKHGRCAMLAVVGYIVTDVGFRFAWGEGVPAGFAALSAMPEQIKGQMVGAILLMEYANGGFTLEGKDRAGTQEFPGDFRNGVLDFGWDKKDDAWKKNKRTIELNNGRAAMMGVSGLMLHETMGNIGEMFPWHVAA
jgi:hypothetical protein